MPPIPIPIQSQTPAHPTVEVSAGTAVIRISRLHDARAARLTISTYLLPLETFPGEETIKVTKKIVLPYVLMVTPSYITTVPFDLFICIRIRH